MEILQLSIAPIEILLQIIFQQYLSGKYCLTIVSENKLNANMLTGNINYMNVNETQNLHHKILIMSEMGCSDFIVQMTEPQKFVAAFEKVNRLGKVRRGNKILIFLPLDKENNPKILLDLLLLKEITLLANLLLIIPANSTDQCESYDIVTHKYVGADDQVNDPLYLDSWDACTQQLKTNSNLFPHDMSNMQGKTLRVATFMYKPYTILDLDQSKYPAGYDGIDFKIVTEFCRWINCTIKIIRDDKHGNEWGDIFENGTSNGIIGNLIQDKADIGVAGLFSWYKPYVHLDFSAPLVRSGVTCVAPAPRSIANWMLPLMAFHWVVWATVIFTFVYASIALYIANGCSSENILLTTFAMMVTQPQPNPGTSWRVRSVTGWLLVTGLLLDNAYGGGLAAVFTVPKYQGSIDTVQDLLDAKLPWGATHISWVFSLSASQDPKVIQLVSQFRAMDEEELKRHSFSRTMAIAVEKLPAGNLAVHDFITKEALVNLQLMVEDIYYDYTVVMGRKSSQYVDKISKLAGRLHEAGVLLAWETQVAIEHLDFKLQLGVKYSRRRKETENKSIDMKHVVGIFSLYMIGVVGSVLLFLIEMFKGRK